LHIHTTCSDGENSYEEIVRQALLVGYDFIAITDHVPTSDEACRQAVLETCQQETRLVCFPGAEVTGRHHTLALGLRDIIDATQPVAKQVAEIHQRGGLAIAAHPLMGWASAGLDPYTADELRLSESDAMECQTDDWWIALLRETFGFSTPPLPCVYDSDAHNIRNIARKQGTYNVCDIPITSLADLELALATGKCGYE